MGGLFLSLDGIDGVGKSTQARRLADWLAEQGWSVRCCRDPGSTWLGERVRGILLDDPEAPIGRRAEMLLYMAARAQLVEEVIRPALAEGQAVICDRYLLANVVYQGHAGGLDVPTLRQIGQVATAGLMPKLTIVLDMSPEAAAARLSRRRDRMEQQGDEFVNLLRRGFLDEAQRDPERIVVIDAGRDVDVVQAEIRSAVAGLLAARQA